MMVNHWPLMRRVPPSKCGKVGDTADPHAAITCLACREMIQNKVDAHRVESERHTAGGPNAEFFRKDSEYWRRVLDQK